MPYGVSWTRFISFASVATMFAMAGAQTIHVIYKPLDDLEELIEEGVKKKLAEKNNVTDVKTKNV